MAPNAVHMKERFLTASERATGGASVVSCRFCLFRFFNAIALTAVTMATAGLPISYTLGRHHNFCCRCLVLIPRPDSETSAQTTRGSVL